MPKRSRRRAAAHSPHFRSVLLDACSLGETKAQDRVIVGEGANAIDDLIAALLQHRFPRRLISGVPP